MRGFESIAKRTAVVRVISGFEDFVAENGVEHTHFNVDSSARRDSEVGVGLLHIEVVLEWSRRTFTRQVQERSIVTGVGSEDQIHLVSRGPLSFFERSLQGELDAV